MIRSRRQSDVPRTSSRRPARALTAGPGLAAGMVLAVAAAACSSGGSSPAAGSGGASHPSSQPPSTAASSPAAMSMLGAHSIPAQTEQTLPAFPAYYDAHQDVVVVSDAFPKSAAKIFHANYAPSLAAVPPASQPNWYLVRGRAAAGQLAVLGSQPGETDYSPLWRTVYIQWKPGLTPKLLTSDNMIKGLVKKGQLTVITTDLVVNSTVISVHGSPVSSSSAPISTLGSHSLPAQAAQTVPAFPAYYDAHKDVVIVSDGFPKAAAVTFHANFAPSLSVVRPASQPNWYLVRGRAAAGQLAVLGSQPGEKDYSPLWRTVYIQWKPGVTPKLLTSDNMIKGLVKKGQLTTTDTSLLVNAAVVSKA